MRLSHSRRRRGRRSRDTSASPMKSVANLVDLMLVFICGLIVAIIMFWNVDLDNLQTPQEDAYENTGQVYQDPQTGKIYVIKNETENTEEGDSSGSDN